MDSSDSKGYEIQSLFYQGAYQACVDLVQENTSGSPSEPSTQFRLLYGARSQIALNKPSAALALLPASAGESPAIQSVRALANFVDGQITKDTNQAEEALLELNELLDQAVVGDIEGQTIRVCVATAMARDDDPVGALEALGMGTATSREIEW
jgi:coatomer protein complex subunit epsilon